MTKSRFGHHRVRTEMAGIPRCRPEFQTMVKNMTEELDILLSYLKKQIGFEDACTSYQEDSVHAFEDDLWHLSERSRSCQKSMEEQLMDIQQLQNKMLHVSARQSYTKGIVELASNKTYWDIWTRQKLDPELEVKQQNILNAKQNLTREIIELERHFNTLEINKFGDIGRSDLDHVAFQGSQVSLREKPLLQSLYGTVNSQLLAAEQFSELLSRQTSNLNINSGPIDKKIITQEFLEPINLSQEHNSFQSPHASNVCKSASEPGTARRRRDSLNRNGTTFKLPKVTVKRETPEQFFRVDKGVPFRKAKQSFDLKKKDFETHQKRVQDNRSRQQLEVVPNVIPVWTNDTSGLLPTESNSNQVPQVQRSFASSPSPSHSFSTVNGTQSSTNDTRGTPMTSSTETTLFANVDSNTKNNSQMESIIGQSHSSADFSSNISSINNRTIITEPGVRTSKNSEDSFSSSVKDSNYSSSLSTSAANFSKNITAASQPNGPPFELPISISSSTSSLVSTAAATTEPLTCASLTSMSFGNSSFSGRLGHPKFSTLAATSASLSAHPVSSYSSSSFGSSHQTGAGIVQNYGSSSGNSVFSSGFGVNAPAAGGFDAAAVEGGGFAAVASGTGGGGGFGALGSGSSSDSACLDGVFDSAGSNELSGFCLGDSFRAARVVKIRRGRKA